jgi:DNA repair exonuclease SbcCD ATPase subunit
MTEDGRMIVITVKGDVESDEATVTVRDTKKDKTFSAPAGKLEELPQEYRELAQEALEEARQQGDMFDLAPRPFWPETPPPLGDHWRHFREDRLPQLRQRSEEEAQKLREELKQLRQEQEQRMKELKEQLRQELDERLDSIEEETQKLREQLREQIKRQLQEQQESESVEM